MAERRVSTPLVLALASAMVAVSIVVIGGMSGDDEPAPPPAERGPRALHVDDSTPEAAAESFYDAWRRREWRAALRVSVGEARREAQAKQARDEAMPREERVVAERAWDAMANAPLHLALDEAEMLGGDRYRLSGTAEYSFVGRPYQRRVSFLVLPRDGRYRVAQMELGDVLTELPPILRGDAVEAP